MFIPIRLDGTSDAQVGRVTSGVSKDVSEQGLLIRTRREFTVGAPVTVAVQLDPQAPPEQLAGVVVRAGQNAGDPGGLWPYEVAIRLDAPEPRLQPRSASSKGIGFVDEG